MSLVREIQSAAVDSSVPLPTLLRKCKLLSARLGSEELKRWIDAELNGYERREDLPSYRILQVHSKGDFSGSFQSTLQNANIPLSCMPEQLRESLGHSYLMMPIASLEATLAGGEAGSLREPWNPDIVAHYGDNIYEGMNCIQAWKVIPKIAVVAVLDTVRTRVLNFALEIEAANPEAGEAPANERPIPEEKVQHIVNTYISGNVQNIANASPGVRQHANWNALDPAVLEALSEALRRSQIPEVVVRPVLEVVGDMARADDAATYRAAYLRFMSIVADHMQVLGPVVAPFLAPLAAILS